MFVEHKEVGEVIEQPAKVLKLSEAMRIGASLRQQGFGPPDSNHHGPSRQIQSCAVQAAVEAVTGRLVNEPCAEAKVLFCVPSSITGKVWKLNDNQRWTRERIADWLEAQGY